jgi:hypothetical protein
MNNECCLCGRLKEKDRKILNLSNVPIEKEIRFDPAQLGLSSGKTYQFSGASFHRSGDIYVGKVSIPAEAHMLIEVT